MIQWCLLVYNPMCEKYIQYNGMLSLYIYQSPQELLELCLTNLAMGHQHIDQQRSIRKAVAQWQVKVKALVQKVYRSMHNSV